MPSTVRPSMTTIVCVTRNRDRRTAPHTTAGCSQMRSQRCPLHIDILKKKPFATIPYSPPSTPYSHPFRVTQMTNAYLHAIRLCRISFGALTQRHTAQRKGRICDTLLRATQNQSAGPPPRRRTPPYTALRESKHSRVNTNYFSRRVLYCKQEALLPWG